MDETCEQEVASADEALQREDFEAAFGHLERAHVLAQRMTGRHTFIHWRMLRAGLRRGDLREVVGQLPRIVVSILVSRLWVPRGNSGRARVSAFKPVPANLRHLVPCAGEIKPWNTSSGSSSRCSSAAQRRGWA